MKFECFRGNRGTLTMLFCFALIIVSSCGLCILGSLRYWRFSVETQLRLNRCVGAAAGEFRDLLNLLVALNHEIYGLRSVTTFAEPSLVPFLKETLAQAVMDQESVYAKWNFKRLNWGTNEHCRGPTDTYLVLPEISLRRESDDQLGPKPFTWDDPVESSVFSVQALHDGYPTRAAVAEIFGGSNGIPGDHRKWESYWSCFGDCSGQRKTRYSRSGIH